MPVKRQMHVAAIVPARLPSPADTLHSAQYYSCPVPPHQWNMAVCAFKDVHPLSETETVPGALQNCFHCNIFYCVFSRTSEIPENDSSLSAGRMYLEA